MAPELSVDVLEMIIDQVALDLRWGRQTAQNKSIAYTLQSCSLTCSALRPRAHYHLYALVKIADTQPATNMICVLRKRPELVQYVKTLVVHLSESDTPWMFIPGAISLVSLLHSFTHVTVLVFSGITFTEFHPQRIAPGDIIRAIPSSVRQLAFQRCEFPDDSVLVDIVRSVTDLHTLRVLVCTSTSISASVTSLPLIPLESLTLDAPEGGLGISRTWTNILSFSSLTDLEFVVRMTEDLALWQALLASAPLIRIMAIRIVTSKPPCLDLSTQRALQTLRVYPSKIHVDPTEPTCVLLSTTRSTSLSFVEVIFCFSARREQLDLIDWANVKRIVVDSNVTWSDIPKLTITFEVLEVTPDSERIMEENTAYLAHKQRQMQATWLHVSRRKTLG
jgi:hypothetical protein